MALQPEVQAPFSTLELVKNDKSANAPETDRAISAPEHDCTAETAQTAFGSDPETLYDSTLPEVVADPLDEAVDVQELKPQQSIILGLPRKTFWTLVVMAILILVGGNIGVSVGVGLRPSRSSINTTPTSGLTSSFTTTIAAPLPSSSPFNAGYAILNDTSLVAVSTSDGNRHVFFQDQSLNIRECIFIMSNGNWSALTTYIIATNAKQYTPISTFLVPQNVSDQGSEEIYLFYIARNNSITFQLFVFNDASWTNSSDYIPNLSSNIATNGSRALSAAPVFPSRSNSTQDISIHLLYEGIQGNMIWVMGTWNESAKSATSANSLFEWEPLGVSPAITGKTPLKNNSGPFYLSFIERERSSAVYSTYVSYFQDTFRIESSAYSLGSPSFVNGFLGYETPSGSLDIHESDFTQDGFWINGSTLWNLNALPDNPYHLQTVPFRRLASVSPSNSTMLHVYRQLNQTIISEETLDKSTGYWSSGNITIST